MDQDPEAVFPDQQDEARKIGILELLSTRFSRLFDSAPAGSMTAYQMFQLTKTSMNSALQGNLRRSRLSDDNGKTILSVAIPLLQNNQVGGARFMIALMPMRVLPQTSRMKSKTR